MLTINREKFIQQLESVTPGIAEREVIEQSACFVFQGGRVTTFNDEIACRQKCDVGFVAAVRAKPLLGILRKLVEDEIDVELEGGEMKLRGKRKEASIIAELKIHLPIGNVEKPEAWHPLHEDFVEAIELVQHCASSDEAQFMLTCVHITPTHVEACDNSQLTQVKVKTPVAAPIMVRRDSIKHVVTLGMTEIAETESWIHFRNPAGLIFSCRRFVEAYLDLAPMLQFTGSPIVLPKGLARAADNAAIFSADSADGGAVLVELRPGKLRIKGTGASGWYRETRKVAYEGVPLAFMIAPALLIDITKRYNDAEIAEGRLRVRGGKWTYISCLQAVEEKEAQA